MTKPRIAIVAGGFVEDKDIPVLEEMGVTGNFTAGTPFQDIVDHIRKVASKD